MAPHEHSTPIAFDDLTPELRDLLAPRVRRLGYLGEFFARGAHQPVALMHFIAFTEELKEKLPFRLVEVIALTVASRTGNAYERVQHERLALKHGFTPGEIAVLIGGERHGAGSQAPEEAAAADLARTMVDTHGSASGPALRRLQRLVGEPLAVGCLMMAARYLAHAAMANAWQLEPPVPSPLAPSATNHDWPATAGGDDD